MGAFLVLPTLGCGEKYLVQPRLLPCLGVDIVSAVVVALFLCLSVKKSCVPAHLVMPQATPMTQA